MAKDKFKLRAVFKKYFIEFLMLFLAVFLGFFADNLRDKATEKSIEKSYIKSLIEDLETDKIQIKKAIKNNKIRKLYIDTLSNNSYDYALKNLNDKSLYKYFPIILIRPDFFSPNELTMAQLKNSGGMRLIRNKEVVREIWKYDLQEKKLKNQQKYYEDYHNNSINLGMKIFNLKQVKGLINDSLTEKRQELKLLKNDKESIIEFANTVSMYGGIVDYYNLILEKTNNQADSLIYKLKNTYKLNK